MCRSEIRVVMLVTTLPRASVALARGAPPHTARAQMSESGVKYRLGNAPATPYAASSFCSSPDWYISPMISEPPMNSPLTYNCGIVGQLA